MGPPPNYSKAKAVVSELLDDMQTNDTNVKERLDDLDMTAEAR